MIRDESSKSFKDRIFTVLNEIDQKVETVLKKGIVFVGLTRVGKSTAYNWAIRHPLQAKLEEIARPSVETKKVVAAPAPSNKKRRISSSEDEDDTPQKHQVTTTVAYRPRTIQTETGEVRFGIKSCTLVPNIVKLNEDTSLLDMAGYGDSRDYVGTLGVSYSLRAIFQVLQQVKFIVVINESALKNIKQLCDTLNHFFSMFDLQRYPDIWKQIFDATSLLITHSVEYTRHFDFINEARRQLKDTELTNVQNRELIADFLTYMKKTNRFMEFRMARLCQPPEQCKILEKFDMKGWKYFNLTATREQQLKKPQDPDIIKLPFQKEYLNLKPNDQQTLMKCIDRRLKSYRRLSIIFASLYERIFVEGSINDINLPYDSFFSEIQTYITENDHYDSQKYIPSQSLLVSQFFKPQRETLFYLLLKIKDVVTFDGNVLGTSKKFLKPTMDLFRSRINELVQLVSVIFCRNKDDYKKMMQLRFILLRGIRQFYMLLHVSFEKVSSCVNEIHDNFQIIFPPDLHAYWEKFFCCFELRHEQRIGFGPRNLQNYMEGYLQTRENAYAIEILFKTHEYDILSLKSQLIDKYYQILRDVKLIHARHQFQKYEYRKCLIYLHEAITLQTRFFENYIKRMGDQLDQSQVDIMGKIMYINQENIFDMIKITCVRMGLYTIALRICKELNWVHSASEIYEALLSKDSNDKDRIEEYAIFCMEHGLPEKGRTLFHRLLEAQRSFARKKEILKKIQDYLDHPQNRKQAYLKFLNHYFVDLIDDRRVDLLNIISESFQQENHNIDKLIDIIKNQNIKDNRWEQIQEQQVLIRYLEQRNNSQSYQTANGFRASYLCEDDKQGIPKITISNRLELKELNIRLIQNLETVSKIAKNNHKSKLLRIDVQSIDSFGISERHILITLDGQQIRSTFEYAVRLMKAIKKLIYEQHYKLIEIIKLARESIQKSDAKIREHLFARYRDSITFQEIQAITAIIQKHPKESNEGIEAEYRKLFKQPKLVRSQLSAIFAYIRHKKSQELGMQVRQNMMQMSSIKDTDPQMENTRDYY